MPMATIPTLVLAVLMSPTPPIELPPRIRVARVGPVSVEIFEGHVRDETGLRGQIDRWAKKLPSGALGWLGATGGIADDGTAILVARVPPSLRSWTTSKKRN